MVSFRSTASVAWCAGAFAACATVAPAHLPPAQGGTLTACSDLATRLTYPQAQFAAVPVGAGELSVAGMPIAAHCRITGRMNERTSPVDGKHYAIGFEMRLPQAWNGRFFYQANGGVDGNVVTATGAVSAGPGLSNPLAQGFAVISSDAGHAAAQNGTFGIDPEARLDYGYRAVALLTPMAKEVIRVAYGRAPDRSYIGGCSNGGRHTLVAAARLADQYDGFLVGDPGTVLPRAAIANLFGGKTYASLATDPADPSTGFTLAERRLVSNAVLGRCDALDGTSDGMVQDTKACQAAFNLERDVPTCSSVRDGTCLSAAQKAGIGGLFAGAKTSAGATVYASFPYDTGFATSDWAGWKFRSPPTRDAGAMAGIFQAPPADLAHFDGRAFMLSSEIDDLLAKVQASDATYTESSMSFMAPPHPTDLSAVRARGGKIMIFHGTSDPIFSSAHSVSFFEGLSSGSGGEASSFARLYLVPGMNHCGGGPSADQFDMLSPLVAWVERGELPAAVTATARGVGNAAGANVDVPASWSQSRTRTLCAYPAVARYVGGDVESAASFVCR
jgi:Tannase and feruloyl esterase